MNSCGLVILGLLLALYCNGTLSLSQALLLAALASESGCGNNLLNNTTTTTV